MFFLCQHKKHIVFLILKGNTLKGLKVLFTVLFRIFLSNQINEGNP